MAIFHLSIKIIGRTHGATAVAKAAYRSGTKLKDERTGITHDYTHKQGVAYSEIILCENAPDTYQSREVLWNAVEKVEKNKNAQCAREIEFALPIEFDEATRLEVARTFLQTFADEGMCVDWSYHNSERGSKNPHVHAMLTTRGIRPNGSWDTKEKKEYALDENGERIPIIDSKTGKQKIGKNGRRMWKRVTVQTNDWNNPANAEIWRHRWEKIVNAKMKELGHSERIDRRSFIRQGLDIEPTIHEGVSAHKIEEKGFVSERCEINRGIKIRNKIRKRIAEAISELTEMIIKKARDIYERYRGITNDDRDIRQAGKPDKYYRRTGEYERFIDATKQFIDRIYTGKGIDDRWLEKSGGRIDELKYEASGTDKSITDLKEIIKQKEEKAYEAIQRIYERHRHSEAGDGIGTGSRGLEEKISGHREQRPEVKRGTSDSVVEHETRGRIR